MLSNGPFSIQYSLSDSVDGPEITGSDYVFWKLEMPVGT